MATKKTAKVETSTAPGWEEASTAALKGASAGDVLLVRYLAKNGTVRYSLSTVVEGKNGNQYLTPGFDEGSEQKALDSLKILDA